MRRTKTMLMGDLLDEFFSRPYVAARVAEGRLPDTWREIVGERAAAETTQLRLENRILHVRIRSSVLRSELFRQREALAAEITRRRCGWWPRSSSAEPPFRFGGHISSVMMAILRKKMYFCTLIHEKQYPTKTR